MTWCDVIWKTQHNPPSDDQMQQHLSPPLRSGGKEGSSDPIMGPSITKRDCRRDSTLHPGPDYKTQEPTTRLSFYTSMCVVSQ